MKKRTMLLVRNGISIWGHILSSQLSMRFADIYESSNGGKTKTPEITLEISDFQLELYRSYIKYG